MTEGLHGERFKEARAKGLKFSKNVASNMILVSNNVCTLASQGCLKYWYVTMQYRRVASLLYCMEKAKKINESNNIKRKPKA